MVLYEILERVIACLRRFQSQIGLSHCAQSRDKDSAARALGSSQNGLEKLKRSLLVV